MLYNCPSSLVRFVSVVCSSLKQSVGDYAHVEIFTFTSAFFICHIDVLMMHKVSISIITFTIYMVSSEGMINLRVPNIDTCVVVLCRSPFYTKQDKEVFVQRGKTDEKL